MCLICFAPCRLSDCDWLAWLASLRHKKKKRLVQHTLGWPLQSGPMSKTYGGSFLYHQEPDLILVGLVVGLDYENPHLNP